MKWFWLSFADPLRPRGSQFLGVVIIEAPEFVLALCAAGVMGINPGGEVVGYEIDPEDLPAIEYRHRLLQKPELDRLVKAVRPHRHGPN